MKSRGTKTLVIGGDVEVSKEIERILNTEGFRAKVVSSLESCMRMIETGAYGMIIVDLSMFRGNELTLLRHIREKNKDIAVLGLGNLNERDPILVPVREMIAGYLEKPADKEVLLQTVIRIAQQKKTHHTMRETLLVTIGKRIRAERKNQSLTLRQVAGRARLSVSLLSQIERAESAASVSSLYKIAQALNTSLRSFFNGY